MKFKITTLIENNPSDDELLFHEHGLSLFIECDDLKILFDTGKSGDFIDNAEKLNIDLNNLDYVILSHGHYDHTGGLKKLIKNFNGSFKLVVGEGFYHEKYRRLDNGGYRFIGNEFNKDYLVEKDISLKYIKDDVTNITDSIMIFTNFERTNDFELYSEKLLVKKDDCYEVDKFLDEISLGIKTDKGIFVIVGCSHVGVVNILETISKRTGMPICGVLGGSHLIEANEDRLDKTTEYFKKINIETLAMSHCTGELAIKRLKEEFSNNFIYNNTGKVIVVD